MSTFTRPLNFITALTRFSDWPRLITITGFSQILIQGLGLIGGILVIRLLPTHEYGLYTLANTMLGTMNILADGGISSSVMSQGGRVWQNREKLGAVLVTGFALRKKFAVASLLFAVPFLLYLLRLHNASWLMSILLVISLVPAFFTALSSNLLSVGPALHQTISALQKNQVGVSIGRLLFLVLTLFIFPWAFVAVLAAGIPQIWANIRLRKISESFADLDQKPDAAIQKEMLAFVKRILPGSIYYCLSGQITIWLISFFGSTTSVAQIGALGRLSMVLSFFSIMFGTLVVPRFARLPADRSILFKRYMQIQLVLIGLVTSLLTAVWLFPSEILWVLGKNYSNLGLELLLIIAISCLGLVSGLSFNLSTCRQWAIHPLISIPITLAAIAISASLFNLSTLLGVLMFNLLVAMVEVIMYISYCMMRIMNSGK